MTGSDELPWTYAGTRHHLGTMPSSNLDSTWPFPHTWPLAHASLGSRSSIVHLETPHRCRAVATIMLMGTFDESREGGAIVCQLGAIGVGASNDTT